MTGLTALALLGVLALGLVVGIAFGAGMTFLILRHERADRRDATGAFEEAVVGPVRRPRFARLSGANRTPEARS